MDNTLVEDGQSAASVKPRLNSLIEARLKTLISRAADRYRTKDGIGYEKAIGTIAAINELIEMQLDNDDAIESGEIAAVSSQEGSTEVKDGRPS